MYNDPKPEDINATTDIEMAFGTTRNLPAWEDIPEAFKQGNLYTELLNCLFAGVPLPDGELKFNKGFEDTPEFQKMLFKWVRAHLTSWEPKHERKIAGLGYAVSKVISLHPIEKE